MAKYTYHHYHPKITEELVSERHNTSIHFYSRQRGARIVKSSHFRYGGGGVLLANSYKYFTWFNVVITNV